jgi:hypothetical protein
MLCAMTGHASGPPAAVVIDLAAFRAGRGDAHRRDDAAERPYAARRMLTPREVAHRRRMLEHLLRGVRS